MSKKVEKSNVMRILDQKKISYTYKMYAKDMTNAGEVADALNQDRNRIFKTLVTISKSKQYYVFMIPGDCELDLKKGAKVVGEKSLEMIPQKELLPLTGYIHGGCSPIGMKRLFKTYIDSSATSYEIIGFSGGRVGCQVQMSLPSLQKVIPVEVAEVIKS